ncbi:hypothetical protein GM658_05180 [Pseudoduganella eburnea]|uniref:PEP-CTERM sorting domain-containing protein n=1 Tax=Massilia eburnea TaxID=1776165 RepID=A0A6L6QE97_9BURK|nr:PEP-CTERM sorting domain-containing protein [Massilia eburnea]MTW09986.1 hypothetical protein [Massilia eburnea]
MKFSTFIAAVLLGAAATSTNATATVLSFDDLTEMMYGDGFPLAANMSYDGTGLSYVESGFKLTLHAPNAAPGAANIGTGTFEPQTFNWHDGLDNGSDTYVTLTRVGGGLFNLASFDYLTDASNVSVDGNLLGAIEDAGTWTTALAGIAELRLSSGAFNQIDNVQVDAAVPLPGTLALMLGGLAAAGLARRRS